MKKFSSEFFRGVSAAVMMVVCNLAFGADYGDNLILNGDIEAEGTCCTPSDQYIYNNEAKFALPNWEVSNFANELVAVCDIQADRYFYYGDIHKRRLSNYSNQTDIVYRDWAVPAGYYGTRMLALRKSNSWAKSFFTVPFDGVGRFSFVMAHCNQNGDQCADHDAQIVVDFIHNGVTNEVIRIDKFFEGGVSWLYAKDIAVESGDYELRIWQDVKADAGNCCILYDNFEFRMAMPTVIQSSVGVRYVSEGLPQYDVAIKHEPGEEVTVSAPMKKFVVGDNNALSVKCDGWRRYQLDSSGNRVGEPIATGKGSTCTFSSAAYDEEVEWQWSLAGKDSQWSSELMVSGDSSVSNFPALVRISPTTISGFRYSQLSSINDISFVDEYGNVLPYEIDTWNPDGESLVWVKFPVLGHRYIMRWQHNAAVVNNPSEVWSDYASVWHLDDTENGVAVGDEQIGDDTSRVQYDSTTNGLMLSFSDYYYKGSDVAASRIVPGKIGAAVDKWKVQGSDNHVPLLTVADYRTASGLAGTDFHTVSFWVYYPEQSKCTSQWRDIFKFGGEVDGTGKGCWGIKFADNSSTTLNCFGVSDLAESEQPCKGWVHFAVVYNKPDLYFYINGIKRGEASVPQQPGYINTTDALYLSPLFGQVDEARVCRNSASTLYMQAEYATVADPDFIEYGPAVNSNKGLVIFTK